MQSLSTDVVIIGGGPAGLACAMQLARYDIDYLIFEKDETGGLLKYANLVENYFGFSKGIKGMDLVKLMRRQLNTHDVNVLDDEIEGLRFEKNHFVAHGRYHIVRSRIAVIASGTRPTPFRDFELPANVQKHVHYEVYKLLRAKSLRIGIIGAGDAAFDYALNLGRQNEVRIFNRRDNIKALPLLVRRAGKDQRISYMENHTLTALEYAEGKIKAVFLMKGKTLEFYFDKMVFALGREPQLNFLSPGIGMQMEILRERKKLFMIGDVVNGEARQLSIATGDGIKCAMLLKDLI